MTIKMIVTDLDGTLLLDDKTVSPRTITALRICRENGIKLVFATGRGASSATVAPPDLFDGSVLNNGAVVYVGNELIYSKLMPFDMIRELLLACDNAGIKIVAENSSNHYSNFDLNKEWGLSNFHFINSSFCNLHDDIEKIYAIVDSPVVPEFILHHLPDNTYMFVTYDDLAMVMHKEATKSKGVAVLAEYWNISKNEILSFGDDLNDIDLLKYSGLGVAMGNAVDEVKAASDHICDTNENDGIARLLESIV